MLQAGKPGIAAAAEQDCTEQGRPPDTAVIDVQDLEVTLIGCWYYTDQADGSTVRENDRQRPRRPLVEGSRWTTAGLLDSVMDTLPQNCGSEDIVEQMIVDPGLPAMAFAELTQCVQLVSAVLG